MNAPVDYTKKWTDDASKLLVGRTIVGVRYMTDDECNDMDWYSRPVVLILDNGLQIYPSRDDEGNDGGALFTTDTNMDCLPVLRVGD